MTDQAHCESRSLADREGRIGLVDSQAGIPLQDGLDPLKNGSAKRGSCATLVDVLRERAEAQPHKRAYSFLDEGGSEAETLTYGELDAHARRIAARLQSVGNAGQRALLMFPAGLDFLKAFFGCLYAGVIAIPVPSPEASRLKRTLPRLRAVVADGQVSVLVSTAATLELIAGASAGVSELEQVKFVDIDAVASEEIDRWQDPRMSPQDLAYLQYTSGSTTNPKGVMLSHGNVVHHCGNVQSVCEYNERSVSVTWLPYFHDYGLVEGLLVPLCNATPCYVMSPFAFLKRPFLWLSAMSRYRATHTQAPNFAYDQCVRRVKPEQVSLLDLSSVESMGNGAEPINPNVLEDFTAKFASCGFRWQAFCPAYGLAEATLMISCCSPSRQPRIGRFQAEALRENRVVPASDDDPTARRITSCGRIVGHAKVVLVNSDTRTSCAPDQVGEIWVSDPAVALGYWQRALETQETFGAFLDDTGEGPFLRTGDLGFLRDGELYIVSRIKDLIIIAGTNHYPQDIEWTVERCHPALRPQAVAAFSIEVGGEERLVIAPEVERGAVQGEKDIKEIFDSVRRAVAENHELQVFTIALLSRGVIPKTASGKIQRHACWNLVQSGCTDILATWTADSRQIQPRTDNPTRPVPAPGENPR